MKFTDKELQEIQEALDKEMSIRAAAREVLGKESRESSIRGAIKRGELSRGRFTADKQYPRILTIDIETAPIQAAVWGLFKQNIGLNMIQKDWYILSYTAKWYGEDTILYNDKRNSWDTEDDYEMLRELWSLLDEADIVVGQNSVKFDSKKINSRLIMNGFKPPRSYKQVDTLQIAKRHFNFTSNKLEYMTDKLCKKYKKLKHGKYPGYELWKECLKGNLGAWQEMEEYNVHDVLSTEELYTIMRPWMNNHPNLNVYSDSEDTICTCGHNDWSHSGYHCTNLSKFDKFRCNNCGSEVRGRVNLLSKDKRATLKANII